METKNEDIVADVAQCERISIKCNALAFSNNIDYKEFQLWLVLFKYSVNMTLFLKLLQW